MRRVALVVCLCAASAQGVAAQPADWGVTRDPFDKTVVARWKAILAKNPYDSALTSLSAMYRKNRSVEQLAQEYREQPDSWAGFVVLARLAGTDTARALTAYKRAVELNPKDAHGWIAIGDASKPGEARAAYERALAVAPAPLQKAVLRKLADLPGDAAARDRAYARLVELDPKNAKLWTDRGDALARANWFAQAIESYTTAEPLLKSDPERRLYVIAQRGNAHEALHDTAAAIADYNLAIAESPKGYYLRAELIGRIIAIHTKAGTLADLLRDYQRAWPEKSRGHFEWATLGQLYAATGAQDAAILALQHAITKQPAELTTQRALVKLLDAQGRHDDATVQLAAAAKAAPRDAPIHFELVQRYWNTDKSKLFATLEELSRTQAKNASVHHELAELYSKLRRVDLMTRELEFVAKLEVTDDNLVALGEAYFVAGREEQAIATWKKIARAGTAKADAALGAVLADHDLTEDALDAYGRALKREPNNAELWRARGAVYEAAERWTPAFSDTDHAVALLGPVSRDAGHAARYQLVRILANKQSDYVDGPDIADHVGDWELRFSLKDDLIAGYLLAEFYGRQPDERLAHILERLHALVPQDHGVTIELVRAYRVTHEFDKAIATANALRAADPSRKDELDAIVVQTKKDQEEFSLAYDEDGGLRDPELSLHEREPALATDATRSPIRAGLRVGLGKGLRGPSASYVTVGAVGTFGSGPVALVTRIDVAQRAGEMRSVTALAGSVGVTARALTTRSLTMQLGAAQRFERRFGDDMNGLEHSGLAVDATLDVIARNLPAGIGMRLEQGLYEHARDTSLLFEMSVELR